MGLPHPIKPIKQRKLQLLLWLIIKTNEKHHDCVSVNKNVTCFQLSVLHSHNLVKNMSCGIITLCQIFVKHQECMYDVMKYSHMAYKSREKVVMGFRIE